MRTQRPFADPGSRRRCGLRGELGHHRKRVCREQLHASGAYAARAPPALLSTSMVHCTVLPGRGEARPVAHPPHGAPERAAPGSDRLRTHLPLTAMVGQARIKACAGDRSEMLGFQVTGPAAWRSGNRRSSAGSAIRASKRANDAPRQK